MKKATVIAVAVCAYWLVRLIGAPAPETIPATVDELQAMEAEHMGQTDWGAILEQHANYEIEE
jgi:hypothetical protein